MAVPRRGRAFQQSNGTSGWLEAGSFFDSPWQRTHPNMSGLYDREMARPICSQSDCIDNDTSDFGWKRHGQAKQNDSAIAWKRIAPRQITEIFVEGHQCSPFTRGKGKHIVVATSGGVFTDRFTS
jgi:hypothetical protein